AADPVHGVLAVVVDERGVLLPVRTAAAEWHLLGTDHHVVDVILAYKRRRRRIAAEDEFVVGALPNVIGEAIRPQPPGVADQLTPPRQGGNRAVVIVRDGEQGGRAGVVAHPIRDLESARVGELIGTYLEVRRACEISPPERPNTTITSTARTAVSG